jgi:hypothetical protein
MKTLIRWLFLIIRAALRFLFIDVAGEGYMKPAFTPSSKRAIVVSPTDDPDDPYYDTMYGEDWPGVLLPGLVLFAVTTCWIWIPLLLWEVTAIQRERFLRWVGDT